MMILKNVFYLKILFLIFVLGLGASCVLSPTPFREVKYHDLGTPPEINKGGPYVEFAKFAMNGPYKTKMVFRSPDNELLINEYHRWPQTPEALLGRYLEIAFRDTPDKGNSKKYSVRGSVLIFEADENKCQANLMVEYTITEPIQGSKKTFSRTISTKMAELKPEYLSKAMNENAAKLAAQMKKDILSMK